MVGIGTESCSERMNYTSVATPHKSMICEKTEDMSRAPNKQSYWDQSNDGIENFEDQNDETDVDFAKVLVTHCV